MNQPSKPKRSDATTAVKKPSAPPSLNFSIKSLDQIRAEKKRKRPHEQDDDVISGPTAKASTSYGGEGPDESSAGSVSQSGEEVALNERSGPGEETDKDLPKEPAPPKRRLVIKRTSLRKNAESAEMDTAGDKDVKRIKAESSAEAESSECTSAKNIPSTKSSEKKDTYFDAICIDKSVPLPDSKQVKESINPNRTVNTITHTSPQDNDISTKATQPNPPPTTSTSRDTGAVATHKRITVLKVKRKTVPSSSSTEEEKRAIKSELDIDASLLLSPVDEAKSLQGGVPERKKSIAEMKAEM